MRNVFLDANILLDFYRFGTDDLSEMEKLVVLIGEKEIVLHTNSQLRSEVLRNREKILAETLQRLRENKFSFRAPKICDGSGIKELNSNLQSANKILSGIISDLSELVDKRKLPADILIKSFFDESRLFEVGPDLIEKATLRSRLGNPPGKGQSIGDAIHWESLLQQNLFSLDIVSRDGDFGSKIEADRLSEFLEVEWKETQMHNMRPVLFRSLTDFFALRFPDIQLTEEVKKNELIDQLRSSHNFAETHSLIAKLSGYKNFTNNQVENLFAALVENSQVGSIATDSDINEFYLNLRSRAYRANLNDWTAIATALDVEQDDFFLPF